jgi:uncharacterized membrane protein YhhN
MAAHLIPIPFLVVTVVLLVRAELKHNQRQIWVLKPISTLLVITVAVLSFLTPSMQPTYAIWIITGLCLSMGGDLALILQSDRAFRIGLILFLLAHIVYAIAFTLPNGFHPQDLISGSLLLVLAIVIYLYLQPGLGKMKAPVLLYILVICLMVNRAVSTFFGEVFSTTQAWLISLGAILFMASDLVLATNRFRHPFRAHRLSLFLYYGGQALIALSPSYFS